jgi:hypothetical protein
MEILAALFIEGIDLRQVPGPSTRIDLTGIQFSAVAPSTPPFTIEPHLVVIVHCPYDSRPTAALEVVYKRAGEQIARNVQPLEVEPGKFNYRLVRAELEFADYGPIEAHCRLDMGPVTVVPYLVLPPLPTADAPAAAGAETPTPGFTAATDGDS